MRGLKIAIRLYKCVNNNSLVSNYYLFNRLSNTTFESDFTMVDYNRERLFVVRYDTVIVTRYYNDSEYSTDYIQFDIFYNGRIKYIEPTIIKAIEKLGYNVNDNLRLEIGRELLRLESVKRAEKYTEYYSKTIYIRK